MTDPIEPTMQVRVTDIAKMSEKVVRYEILAAAVKDLLEIVDITADESAEMEWNRVIDLMESWGLVET